MNPTLGSTGSLIIDDIIFEDGTQQLDVIGGAGVFAIYGMRIWYRAKEAKHIAYIAQCGFDHPKTINDTLHSLDMNIIFKTHSDQHTTKGLNTFGPNDHREFIYIYPRLRTSPTDFPDTWIRSITMLHIISSTQNTIKFVKEWRAREVKLNKQQQQRTLFLWEPNPWACIPANYQDIIEAGKYVDIISPNHEESAAMLGIEHNKTSQSLAGTMTLVETCGLQLSQDFPHATILIRASKHGAAVWTPSTKILTWIPPYWTTSEHVIDVVGAGNAFCGGFMVGWQRTNGDAVESALYGSVSSSFVVEQVGVPILSTSTSNNTTMYDQTQQENALEEQIWNNGPSPTIRLEQLKSRFR